MEICLFSRHTIDELKPLRERFPGWQLLDAQAPLPAGGIVVSYGGDGTFLDCVRRTGSSGVPILGVNSGRLGFLANVPAEALDAAVEALGRGEYTIERRPLIEAVGDFESAPDFPCAFNEFSLHRGSAEMIAVEVEVDGQAVATIWGDGVLVATPAGSTAYALSVGGPVVAPGCDCRVIAPIAPHNLTMRPVVVPGESRVRLRVRARHGTPYATLDNRIYSVRDGAAFELSKAPVATNLVRLHNNSFYATLSEKLSWGTDKRAIFAC